MKTTIDWKVLPYDHSGKWHKKFESIMNPAEKVTWPQLIAEYVIFFRTKILTDYKGIVRGKNWSNQIQSHVRKLNQQAANITRYFPHPDDEPLVIAAFRTFFRKNKPLKLGRYTKTRVTNKNGKESLNITQIEKDIVSGVMYELEKLIKQRDVFPMSSTPSNDVKQPETITYNSSDNVKSSKAGLNSLIEMEKSIDKASE